MPEDEFDDDNDGDLAGAGSLLSINIRNKHLATARTFVRPRTLSEKLLDRWNAVMAQKEWVGEADLAEGQFADTWSHCFEFERDPASGNVRVKRIGKIFDGFAGLTESGFSLGRRDAMRRTPEIAAMLITWLRSLAERSYKSREPQTESESFPIDEDSVRYTCTVVPLIDQQSVPVSVVGLIESVESHSSKEGH